MFGFDCVGIVAAGGNDWRPGNEAPIQRCKVNDKIGILQKTSRKNTENIGRKNTYKAVCIAPKRSGHQVITT